MNRRVHRLLLTACLTLPVSIQSSISKELSTYQGIALVAERAPSEQESDSPGRDKDRLSSFLGEQEKYDAESRAEIEKFTSLIEDSRNFRDEGKYERSLDALKSARSILESAQIDTLTKDLVGIPLYMGFFNTLMMLKQHTQAKEAIEAVVQFIEKKSVADLIKTDYKFLGTAPFSAYYKAAQAALYLDKEDAIRYLDKGKDLFLQSTYMSSAESSIVYHSYSDLYTQLGQYEKAIELLSALASQMLKDKKQSETVGYARLLHKIADISMVSGNNGYAELLIQGAIEIYSKDRENYWYELKWAEVMLNRLQGKLADAIKIAESIEKRAFNEERKGELLKSFALQTEFADRGEYKKVYSGVINRFANLPENYFDKEIFRDNPQDFLLISNSLTRRYLLAGRISEARSMLDAALDIALTELGKDNFLTIKTLLLLAETDEVLNIDRAKEMYRKLVDLAHQNNLEIQAIDSLSRLTYIEAKTGNVNGAIDAGRTHALFYLDFLIKVLPGLSREDRINTISLFNSDILHTLSISHPNSVEAGLWAAINERGLLNHIEITQRKQSHDSRQSKLLMRLGELASQDEYQYLESRRNSKSYARNAELLYNQITRFNPNRKFFGIKEFTSSLPQNSTYIHFVRFRKHQFSLNQEPQEYYGAYISSGNGDRFIEVGSAERIDNSIKEAIVSARQNHGDVRQKMFTVYKNSFKMLFQNIEPGSRIFISLDSEMNAIPLGSLYIDSSSDLTLTDRFNISIVSSPRDYVSNVENSANMRQHKPAILADPVYRMAENSGSRYRSSGISSAYDWSPLMHASAEGTAVFRVIGGDLYTQERASKKTLKALSSPKVLHIAAHGFFEPVTTSVLPSRPKEQVLSLYERIEGYLHQSGIALSAQADSHESLDNDAILSAAEAAYLDLRGTELVVLSACSTGEGFATNGLGIFGLYRSFIEAGATSVLISLWKVDDHSTAEFMSMFYKQLKAGHTKTEALWNTQRAFRSGEVGGGKWIDPYYWAAWQLVGDWRPIQGL